MKSIKQLAIKIITNKIIIFIATRYITYFIQFVNSLFIAIYLGPFNLGIWGFITLITQYINQINFGIAYSVNAIISVHKNKEKFVKKIIGNSISMLLILSVVVLLFFIANSILNTDLGSKYNFTQFAPLVILIGVIGYFNSLFSNIFRVYGKLLEIAISQTSLPIFMSIAIILFKGEKLIWALIAANLLSLIVSLYLFIHKMPLKIKVQFNFKYIKKIQKKGWYLFIYGSSFYLIIISTRTFISSYYNVIEFGIFTFAFSLANVILLLFESISFLIFPKLINQLAYATSTKAINLLNLVRDVYMKTSHLLVHIAILLYPIFLIYFPNYLQSKQSFNFTALTLVLYTNSFGFSGLIIAKEKEKSLSIISFSALIINILMSFLLIQIFNVDYSFVILATMLSYLIYALLIAILGYKILKLKINIRSIIKDIYPYQIMIPFILSLYFTSSFTSIYLFIIPFLLFVLLNLNIISSTKLMISSIFKKPDIINI